MHQGITKYEKLKRGRKKKKFLQVSNLTSILQLQTAITPAKIDPKMESSSYASANNI